VAERTGNAWARFKCAAKALAVTSNTHVNKTLNVFMLSHSLFQNFTKSEARPFCCRCLDYRNAETGHLTEGNKENEAERNSPSIPCFPNISLFWFFIDCKSVVAKHLQNQQ
jgi:hypothetical protein